MYFQDILQGIASHLMDSNLFQLKSSTFCKMWVGAGHLGIFYQHISKHLWDWFSGNTRQAA